MNREHLGRSPATGRAEQPLEPFLNEDRPVWEAIDFDVRCARCDYDLRSLATPHCPECGLTFNWHDVLSSSARKSDFLFEHHWSVKPFRSWFGSVWHALRPVKFWKQVSIHDRLAPGPLWFLLLTSVLWWHGLFYGSAWVLGTIIQKASWYAIGPYPGAVVQTVQSSLFALAGSVGMNLTNIAQGAFGFDGLMVSGILILILLVTLVVICCLRQTLQRCKVRAVQILRVFAYAAAPFFIATAAMMIAAVVVAVVCRRIALSWAPMLPLLMAAGPVALLGIYVGAGLKHYLRLPRAYVTVIISAFTGGLFVITALAVVLLGLSIGT